MDRPCLWKDPNAVAISKEESLTSMRDCKHAAHAMIYSFSSKSLFGRIPMQHNILITMRFDGTFGFPGGLINNIEGSESIEDGLNRELREEINLDLKFFMTENEYFRSYLQTLGKGKLVNHFYLKQVSESEFFDIEKRCIDAGDWGTETLGIVRVPVQEKAGYHQKNSPIVNFLRHNFVGNAKQELVEGMIKCDIFSHDEMLKIWKMSGRVK
uniref:U8 snoRNA-decapping enzyme-like n=1 Tax=Styela clava TaxID=7725 RepID=UPI00193A0A6A|nr:U8 snoRNA-decapping enzyme-like [Styela clava]